MSQKQDFSFMKGRHASPEGGRKCYGYIVHVLMKMYAEDHRIWKVNTIPVCTTSENHQVNWYFLLKENKEFNIYLKKFIKDPSLLKELEGFILVTLDKFKAILPKKKITLLSDPELSKLISSYYKIFGQMVRAAGILRWIDRSALDRIRELKKQLNLDDSIFSILSSSTRKTFATQEHLALIDLALKSKQLSNKQLKENLKDIKDKFSHATLGYYNEQPKSLEIYEKELNDLIKSNPQELLRAFHNKEHAIIEERRILMQRLSKEDKILAEISAESTYIKDYYKFSINELEYLAEPLFCEISVRTGKDIDFIKDLFPEEAISLINKNKIDEDIIKDRVRYHITLGLGDKLVTLTGKEAREFEEKFIKIENLDKREFKGRVACKGFVKGKAKIILGTDDFHKFNKGDIIVATNTSPDFVPLMKKASAIIAEEGGLTAHVSVVSREMNIPCIVGVVKATKIFKDNELIEVDANKGVVKKL